MASIIVAINKSWAKVLTALERPINNFSNIAIIEY